MRTFTRWALLPILAAAAFAFPSASQAHIVPCYTTAKTTEAKHACDSKNRHHGKSAVAWAKQQHGSVLPRPMRLRIVRDHAWLARTRHARIEAFHAKQRAKELERIPTRWRRIADCETGGDEHGRPPYRAVWDYNGSSGFDGGIQFSPGTWNMAKVKPEVRKFAARYAFAYQAPAWVQVAVAENWLRLTSWLQWPSCSRSVGLR